MSTASQIKKELELKEEQIAEAIKEQTKYANSINQLKKEEGNLRKDIDDLSVLYKKKSEEIERVTNVITELEKDELIKRNDIGLLKQELADIGAQVTILTKNKEKLSAEINSLHESIKEITSKIQVDKLNAQSQLGDVKRQIEKEEQRVAQLKEEGQAVTLGLEETHNTIKKTIAEKEEAIKKHDLAIEDKKDKEISLDLTIQSKQEEVKILTDSISTKSEQIEKLQKSVEELNKEEESLKQKTKEAQQEYAKMTKKVIGITLKEQEFEQAKRHLEELYKTAGVPFPL